MTRADAAARKKTKARRVVAKKKRPVPDRLVVDLRAPGMTSILRAGVGGLAASLHAMARQDATSTWPDAVRIGAGVATVGKHHVTLDFAGKPPNATLDALFERSFLLTSEGLIDLPGAYSRGVANDLPVLAALQGALKRTFLQHGSSTKGKKALALSLEVDGRSIPFSTAAYSGYNHRDRGAAEIQKAMSAGGVKLAGWAYPGAAQRHVMFSETKVAYPAEQALAACFGVVGNISLNGPGRMGVLVTPEPTDLLLFAARRQALTPSRVDRATVAGPSDAVLLVNLTLRTTSEEGRGGVGRVTAVLLKPMPWDSKQKYRARTVNAASIDDALLDRYEASSRALPRKIRVIERTKKGKIVPEGYFVATSALRAFIADNLAAGRPWHLGFATAKADDHRIIHRYRSRADTLGALFLEERKGLVVMSEHLENEEKILVNSVHQALRQRFGAIAQDSKGSPAAMKNRFRSERDRWRHAFAGAKTHEQVRRSLADLWSSAGTNRPLQESWQEILPLLRKDRWMTARDLALVALASYAGRSKEENAILEEISGTSPDEGEEQ